MLKTITTPTSAPESVVNNQTRVFTDMPVGDNAAQGDLYFACIAALPKSAKPRTNQQLADGGTMGSRHIVERGSVYDADPAECVAAIKDAFGLAVEPQYIGPVIVGPAYVDHPEHGHHDYQCYCVLVTVFQRSLDAEERERRVID